MKTLYAFDFDGTITDRDLMICNAEEPMCIGGVFGGLDSGVTDHVVQFVVLAVMMPPLIWLCVNKMPVFTGHFDYLRIADGKIAFWWMKKGKKPSKVEN